MTTLSSKVYTRLDRPDLVDAVCAWVRENALGRSECQLKVTLETIGKARTQKKTAMRQLEELVVDSVGENENTSVVWDNFGYRFCFLSRKYYRRGREIYVTANEALFLYRWLVLGDDVCKAQTHYLWNMRRRFGKDFLSEVAEYKKEVVYDDKREEV